MGRMRWGASTAAIVAAAVLVLAGCSSTVAGQAFPEGGTPQETASGLGGPGGPFGQALPDGPLGPDASASGGGGSLCDTLSPDQLAEVGLAGAVGEATDGGPVSSCYWNVPGTFAPVILMYYRDIDLQTVAAAGASVAEYRETQIAGRPALEGGAPAGTDICSVFVGVDANVLSLIAPGSCDTVRRAVELVIPNLPS